MLSARTVEEGGSLTPEFDHMALLIRLEERWLVDVGFGDLSAEPKRLDMDGPQMEDGKAFRIAPVEGGRLLSRWDEGKDSWKPEYQFKLTPRKLEDFAARSTYQQTAPGSYFRRGGFCSILTPAGRLTVTEKKLIVTRAGRRSERPVRDKKDFRAAAEKIRNRSRPDDPRLLRRTVGGTDPLDQLVVGLSFRVGPWGYLTAHDTETGKYQVTGSSAVPRRIPSRGSLSPVSCTAPALHRRAHSG